MAETWKSEYLSDSEMSNQREQEGSICHDNRFEDLTSSVFENSLLREKILTYVIFDDHGKVLRSNTLSCRLVQKLWLDSVTKCFLKTGDHLFEFIVTSYNLKTLDVWKSICFSNMVNHNPVPPLKLSYSYDSMKCEKRIVSLNECIRFCGPVLISLDLDVLTGIYQSRAIPNWIHKNQRIFTFPLLHHLSLHFFSRNTGNNRDDEVVHNGVEKVNAWTELVQNILSGSQKLACITLKGFPIGFENLLLPSSIQTIDLAFQTTTNRLEVLIEKNTFPNLTELSLIVPSDSPQGYIFVYRLLNRFRDTLKKLKLVGSWRPNQEIYSEPVLIQIPVMKQLTTLAIRDRFHVLANIEITLAAVKTVKLLNITPKMFQKYAISSRFKSAVKLTVEFLREESFLDQEVLTTGLAQMLYNGFKFLTSLVIITAFRRDLQDSLPLLFIKMSYLKELSIIVENESVGDCSSQFWNSVLVGIPDQVVTELESYRDIWDLIHLDANRRSSVGNLTELLKLKLMIRSDDDFPPLVLSDVLFEFVLLKMAKLKTLELGSIEVSSTSENRWKKSGRVLRLVDIL